MSDLGICKVTFERENCPFPGADTALCTQQQLHQEVMQEQGSKIQNM